MIINITTIGKVDSYTEGLDEHGGPQDAYALGWSVLFDNADLPAVRPLLAANAPGIPKRYDLLAAGTWMYCREKKVSQRHLHLYDVWAYYYSIGNPLEVPPVIIFEEEATQEPIDRDIHGGPIVNAAGQVFDPAIVEVFHDTALRITVNRATFDPVAARRFTNAVNQDEFFGFEAGQVLCRKFTSVPTRGPGMWYFPHHYEFVIRDDAGETPANETPANWRRRIKNIGFMCFVEDEENEGQMKLVRAKDDEGEPTAEPVRLDTDGKRLITQDPLEATWLLFETKKTREFSELGLDDVYAYWQETQAPPDPPPGGGD